MSVNRVILVGNAGKDPEVRYLDNNRVVANFSLATHEVGRDSAGNRLEHTEWHTIELWDDLARTAEKHVKKGRLLYIEGKIRTITWTDKEGHKKTNRVIRATAMTFIGNSQHPDSPHNSPVAKNSNPRLRTLGENDRTDDRSI